MTFAALPPEVSSGWMYTGPGAESMLSAATAWDGLAGELSSAAAQFQAVIASLLADPWQGPASAAMNAAAAPYTEWMTVTAEQARQAGTQARAAAAAYQAAHAAIVPPPVIAANRSTLHQLLATNVIGQNSAAIAANQAAYGEMWAQNATTMDGYANASGAAATTLTPFSQPAQATNQAGQSQQAAAVGQATAQTGASQSGGLTQFLTQLNNFLETNPLYTAANHPLGALGKTLSTLGAPGYMAIATPMQMCGPIWHSFFAHIEGGAAAAATMGNVSGSGLGQTLVKAATPALGAGATAGLGRAASVGGLSVPQSWATPIQLASAASPLPAAGLAGVPAAGPGGMGGMGGVPMVPALVDKPGNHPGIKGQGAKIVAQLGAGNTPGQTRRGASGIASPLSDRERNELDKLRAIVADLTNQRDKAANSIKEAIRS